MTDSSDRERVVLDASALVDLLAAASSAAAVQARLRGTLLHAPSHLDAEVLSALGRLYRGGELSVPEVDRALERLTAMPVTRHPTADLLAGAWARRDGLRLVDALYVELATRIGARLLTLDQRLARACPIAEAITAR